MSQHATHERRAKARTCDELGVCKAITGAPCRGCGNAHPAYHHLHRLAPKLPSAPACTADRCQQGHRACPCPQACQLPDPTNPANPADPMAEPPATRTELIGFAAWAACVAAAIVFVLISSASA